VRSLRSEYGKNVVPFCPTERCTVGLTIEETIEFEALDALPPFDDIGNIAWVFEGEPTTRREKRWLELYLKGSSVALIAIRGATPLTFPRPDAPNDKA
jgi:hypothetical protein